MLRGGHTTITILLRFWHGRSHAVGNLKLKSRCSVLFYTNTQPLRRQRVARHAARQRPTTTRPSRNAAAVGFSSCSKGNPHTHIPPTAAEEHHDPEQWLLRQCANHALPNSRHRHGFVIGQRCPRTHGMTTAVAPVPLPHRHGVQRAITVTAPWAAQWASSSSCRPPRPWPCSSAARSRSATPA